MGTKLVWKTLRLEALADDRDHLLVDELAYGILHQPLLVAEHAANVVKVERIGHLTLVPSAVHGL